jgi:integrase
MAKLTKRVVEAAPVSEKAAYIWDDQLPGFGVKVLPSGQRRYLVKYRANGGGRTAPQRWYTLGTHGAITTDQARDLAQQVLAAVARGVDPQGNKFALRGAPIMEDLWARYENDHLPRKKKSSQHDDRQKWRDYIAPRLGRNKVHLVNHDDIFSLHKELGDRPYQANRVLALMSKLFNLAERWNMRPDGNNPCRHVPRYEEQSRERYLTVAELGRLGEALEAGLAAQSETPHMVAAVKLLLLTGARLNEILTAEWEWVDLDRRVITLPDSKTGRKPLYLSEAAVEVLRDLQKLRGPESRFVIAGRFPDRPLTNLTKPWKRIRERAGIEDVRLHDLRHTAASIGVSQGMNLPVIGRLLGHTQASTTQRYAHVDIDPALAAADKIGTVVAGALTRAAATSGDD